MIPPWLQQLIQDKNNPDKGDLLKGQGENGQKISNPLCYAEFYISYLILGALWHYIQ